jgi:hypothetical protein
MSILVAFFNPSVGPDPQWRQCYFAHVSRVNHAQIPAIIAELANPLNMGQAGVVIGGKVGMLASMLTVAQRFATANPLPHQVLIYSATGVNNFAFGMRRNGEFGQMS